MDARRAPISSIAPPETFAQCLISGLARNPKEIPCKYFYDEQGSRIFDAICALPEYYQTRTEIALLNRHAAEIAALIGDNAEIIEFGAVRFARCAFCWRR